MKLLSYEGLQYFNVDNDNIIAYDIPEVDDDVIVIPLEYILQPCKLLYVN